jgi:hypothetical protein
MKFTAAATATVLASSITASAESLPNPAGGSLSNAANDASHRSLAVAMKGQDDIHGIFKERRSLKKTNNVIRNLQDKLKRRKLRNQATEDGSTSNAELDLGLFSRDLQLEQNITEAKEEEQLSFYDNLVNKCSNSDYCTCSNVDADAYTANVVCSYEEECSDEDTACDGTAKVCYTSTAEFDLTAPQTGSIQYCWDVSAPLEFSYCYRVEYYGATGAPEKCFLEIDGTECNSCEFIVRDGGGYCVAYDCSNVDAYYVGTECGVKTIVAKKVEDTLIYSYVPCENGCNICPEGEEMTIFDELVSFTLGDEIFEYTCAEMNLAGLYGTLNVLPGDMCYSLEPVVDGPCACEVPPTPVTATDEAPVEGTLEGISSEGTDKSSSESESAGARFGSDGFAIVAIVASIFSWTMM